MPEERILVVDDDESIREIISSMLTHAGYECRTVTSAPEGARGRCRPTTVMPSCSLISSWKVWTDWRCWIASGEAHPQVPVVMVTAIHDISVALAAIRSGAYDYLLKPFEREQLIATVQARAGKSPPEVGKPGVPEQAGGAGFSPH